MHYPDLAVQGFPSCVWDSLPGESIRSGPLNRPGKVSLQALNRPGARNSGRPNLVRVCCFLSGTDKRQSIPKAPQAVM